MKLNGWRLSPTALTILSQLLIIAALWGRMEARLGSVEVKIDKLITKEEVRLMKEAADREHNLLWNAVRKAEAKPRR